MKKFNKVDIAKCKWSGRLLNLKSDWISYFYPWEIGFNIHYYKELNFTFWGIFTLYKIPFFV